MHSRCSNVFEAKLEKHQGNLLRSAVELAKDWRTDRMLRRLEAMLAVVDRDNSLVITGNGDVLEPELGIVAIGSGGPYAQAAARGLLENTELTASEIVKKSLDHRRRLVHLYQSESPDRKLWTKRLKAFHDPNDPRRDRFRARQAHRRPGARQTRRRHRPAQPLAQGQVEEPLRSEITPKNILMIGPTGVGKTEIARRLARLANAPFMQGRGDQVYRGRLRRPRCRHHHPRPGRNRHQGRREAAMRAVQHRARTPPRTACWTLCCHRHARRG